jgi:hypothetical protein
VYALLGLALMGPFALSSPAARFVDFRPVDRDYLMVTFKDGEVVYRDDGTGPSAYLGHAYAEGDARLVSFGEALNVEAAARPAGWTLRSADDERYGAGGLHPTVVHRKAKADNVDHDWNYKLDHTLFLKLPHPLQQGASYSLAIDPATESDTTRADLRFDVFSSMSEAVHVNLIGYLPDAPVKSADLYLWLGDGGPRDYRAFEGHKVYLVDAETGQATEAGRVSFWKKAARELGMGDLTGSDVWNADVSAFNRPGRYRLAVEGVGCSPAFEIGRAIYREPIKTSVRGYFYMRIGEDGKGVSPIPRRPLFVPGVDPEGFTIYITDLHPYHEAWRRLQGDVWDEPHFKPAAASIFWQHRLPGNPTNPHAVGGHSDAMDWDRHLGHIANIYDLLLPYLLSGGALDDDDFAIAESGNGIPDLIDEARNEVDFWLSLRHQGGYAHGLTNPSKEKSCMFQAGTTSMAAWASAANCAMLADCFRIAGHRGLAAHYRKEAETAYRHADGQVDPQLDTLLHVGNASMRGRDLKMMAAAFLFNVTGNRFYESAMVEESVAGQPKAEIAKRDAWNQLWGTAAYLFTSRERAYPDLYRSMKAAVLRDAMTQCVAGTTTRPSRRSSSADYWQTAVEVHPVLLAHASSDNAAVRERLLGAMLLEADWGLGRNPMNMVHMTGLGSRSVTNCYTTGGNDGTPGLHPGHTPYMNGDPWGTRWNGANPHWFKERCYPDWVEGGWPHQEVYFNCRYAWANSEFTPRQTMRGKNALYGYLYYLGK